MSIALWAALAVAIDAALIAAAIYFIGRAGENAEPDDLMAIADAVQEPDHDHGPEWRARAVDRLRDVMWTDADDAMVAELLGGNA